MRLENYVDSLLDYEYLWKFKFLWKQLKRLNLSRYLFWQLNIIVIIIYYYILLVTHLVSSNYKWDVALIISNEEVTYCCYFKSKRKTWYTMNYYLYMFILVYINRVGAKLFIFSFSLKSFCCKFYAQQYFSKISSTSIRVWILSLFIFTISIFPQ